ncbi:pyrroline-5-carboxylate reductase-like [Patiria miniata]|uniref:Pyrroline-5-carboxylate reductase n=1 Tax=Patiria miniata TaxID=46514 RepID=A0A913ZM63_PATMI|nr:pyrroline-5-carboxylate reductase-like [Patiria miniata]XP_038052191.1 pyrroline-5-carboxylate reductase-like [Patiria miniata]XP_038052192.1 pyrroline-5-carboxylate reductase-like [Patiria miniata]XP_038052193.1 pyrroline-5-carboxylate reductase-like [Patiria miniata]XP_038052194.1 pyrroline-5-carboxylate reductase-like [Patiria miniata]XP_038052195.1 pyrroline-5-carboxylate reductase-like [Patiria miniata]
MEESQNTAVDLSDMIVGFIGGGNMAQSIIKGLLRENVFRPEQFIISAPSDRNLKKCRDLGLGVTRSNTEVADSSSFFFLACKPYHMVDVMAEIESLVGRGRLVIPISVGTPVEMFEKGLPNAHVIRVMPSLPNEVAAGIAAYTSSSKATPDDKAIVEAIFKPLGVCEEVKESMLDITAQLGGAACAWHAMIIEALADGAVKMGLPRDLANKLAPQSMLGAAKLIVETGIHPAQVKDNVTSPGGTTIRGVHIMEQRGVRGAMMDAVEGAVLYAREIAKQ